MVLHYLINASRHSHIDLTLLKSPLHLNMVRCPAQIHLQSYKYVHTWNVLHYHLQILCTRETPQWSWNSLNTILQCFGVWSSENNFPQARMDIALGSSTRNGAHSSSAWNDIWFVSQNSMNTTHFEEIWSSFTCIQPSKDDILLHDYVFLLHFPGMIKVLI